MWGTCLLYTSKRCVDSILEKSTYENYEIIVVENNSTTPEIFAYYKELQAAYENGAVSYTHLDVYKRQAVMGAKPGKCVRKYRMDNDRKTGKLQNG